MKKTGIILIFLFVLLMGNSLILMGQEERLEKIAIAADRDTIESRVENQGARCIWFLFFDEKGMLIEALENPYKQEKGGAGISSANFLAQKEITIFVAGNVGDKMRSALESNEITFIAFSGSVKDAITHVLEEINE